MMHAVSHSLPILPCFCAADVCMFHLLLRVACEAVWPVDGDACTAETAIIIYMPRLPLLLLAAAAAAAAVAACLPSTCA